VAVFLIPMMGQIPLGLGFALLALFVFYLWGRGLHTLPGILSAKPGRRSPIWKSVARGSGEKAS